MRLDHVSYVTSHEQLADDFIDGRSALTADKLTTLTSLSKYMALDLFHHPAIRSWVRKLFYGYVTVSTEPTFKGQKEPMQPIVKDFMFLLLGIL